MGAEVALSDGGRTITTKTNGFGDFEFEDLPANASYTVTVQTPGYKPATLQTKTSKDINLGDIVLNEVSVDGMAGIASYGAYIPFYRLSRAEIGKAWGSGGGPGERAVANYDEDSLTMAVAAARDCLKGFDRAAVGGLYFASTTAPYQGEAERGPHRRGSGPGAADASPWTSAVPCGAARTPCRPRWTR